MFVVTLTYKVPLDLIDQHRPAHIEWLKGHYAAGRFVVSGRQNPPVGGLIIATGTRADVEAAINDDPFKVHNLADYMLTEFIASLTAPGLERFKD